MSKHDESRRAFLVGAAVGAVAGAGLVPDAMAQTHEQHAAPFVRLGAARQDEVIAALEDGKATEFTWPTAQAFFNTLRTHTMEGMFADPIYGGNKEFAGWRLVGFPGAQPDFTQADMQSKQAFTRVPIVGLQAQARG